MDFKPLKINLYTGIALLICAQMALAQTASPTSTASAIQVVQAEPQSSPQSPQSNQLSSQPCPPGCTARIKLKSIRDDPEMMALNEELQRLKLQNAALATKNLLEMEKYRQQLLELQGEKDKLELLNELYREKTNHELMKLTTDKEKLLLENELYAAEQKKFLQELVSLKKRLELENEVHEQEKKKVFAKLEMEREQLAIKNALQEEKNKQQELEIQLETAKLQFEMAKLEFEKTKRTLDLDELTEKISAREQKTLWDSEVNKPKEYLTEPFVDGHLLISDRKIELGLVIIPGTAQYVNERIHYYNNKSTEYPIFLVIDTCYGGSVMEGAKILEMMHSSRAPVYVVVKSFAASMAAVMTTLAQHSYAYPNAVILHHQVWTFAFGNQTEIKEQLEIAEEWTQRVLVPVAEKMGISMAQFVEKMYENNSSGNWNEFANQALQYKWVDTVVKDIRDRSFIKQPVDEGVPEEDEIIIVKASTLKEKVDLKGQRYVELPRLSSLDLYYLYNPDNYFR